MCVGVDVCVHAALYDIYIQKITSYMQFLSGSLKQFSSAHTQHLFFCFCLSVLCFGIITVLLVLGDVTVETKL